LTTGKYINDAGLEVPDNKIVVVPNHPGAETYHEEIIESLAGSPKRDWFNSHFYYCLPIGIGNQYGFVIRSLRDLEITWDGSNDKSQDLNINFLNSDNEQKQTFFDGFSTGILTIQNHFTLRTPPGINLMTIQPPNMFIPGTVAMTGVIESDQLRRDFTFNLKVTIPNYKIKIKKGDPLGAFIPVPRYFVENFSILSASECFSEEVLRNEYLDSQELSRQRAQEDKSKPHESGRKYFNGHHAFGEQYKDHQKRITKETD
jgi:hypothetical protein